MIFVCFFVGVIFISELKREIINLIGLDNAKKIFDNHIEKYINISELTKDNLEYAHDFFETIDYKDISRYISDNFSFMDIVKKYYDIELPLDIVLFDAKRNLILDRRFSFYVKKKIVSISNSCENSEQHSRFNKILELIDDDKTFMLVYQYFTEIILCDKLYDNLICKKNNLMDAALIAKYNLHNLKKELNFENLSSFANILDISTPELRNIVYIWLNNISTDNECEEILPVFASIINCEKLTDDVAQKKISVPQAVKIYQDINQKVHNKNLSLKNINSALSIVLKLRDDDTNKNKDKLKTATEIISMIKNDHEFLEVRFFISALSKLNKLPDFIIKNNMSISQVLPLAIMIYLTNSELLLQSNFSFKCLCDIIDLIRKFKRNEKNISDALVLLEKLDSDEEFYYCKDFIFKLVTDKNIFKKAYMSKAKIFYLIQKLRPYSLVNLYSY